MSRPRKRFEDHSERWQRQARREGIDPRKWNRWLKLSPSTQKQTDPRRYGAGSGIAAQRRARAEAAAAAKFSAISRNVRMATVQHNVAKMTNAELRKLAKMTPAQLAMKARTNSGYWYH